MNADTSEIADRILSELEEAGHEELVTLVNTVSARTGEDNERATFLDAIIHLVELGEIVIARESQGRPIKEISPQRSIDEARQATTAMVFDRSEGYWTDLAKSFDVYAVALPGGLERARSLLHDRGYQWWRQ